MSDHARLAPSSAHRWMNCPGAPTLEAPMPDVSSKYAAEGTMLHNVMSDALPWVHAQRVATAFSHLAGKTLEGFPVVTEHLEVLEWCAQRFLDHVPAGEIALFEQRVYIPGRDDLYGTSDVIAIDRTARKLIVIDWKFGAGVKVLAEENEQAIVYALGALLLLDDMYDIDSVDITIAQPRLDHHDVWTITADMLRGWLPRLLSSAARTDIDTTVYVAGDWCRFCKAQAVCPTLRAQALAAAQSEFSRVELANPTEIGEAMQAIPRIESWIKAVQAEAFRRLNLGMQVPGYKLAEGRRAQFYVDPDKAVAFATRTFGRDGFSVPTVLTPAALRDLAKKRKVDLPTGLIDWKKGELRMVSIDDARPEKTSVELDFDDLPLPAIAVDDL